MEKPLTPTTFGLASWFTNSENINGPEHDFLREEILHSLSNDTQAWGSLFDAKNSKMAVMSSEWKTIIEPHHLESNILVFDVVNRKRWWHVKFWMNKTSVYPMLQRIVKRTNFKSTVDDIFSA